MPSRSIPRRARSRLLAGGVALAVLAGALVVGLPVRAHGYRVENRTITVATGPGGRTRVPLDTALYVPDSASARHPAPAVLLPHGFGGSKSSVADDAADLARLGYVVLTWSAEGFGRSGGRIHLDSPDYEVTDARRLIDWLARRPDVRRDGPGNPRVAVVGGSYGGGLALLAAAYDHRIDAIVPQITWNDLTSALFPGGVVKRAWLGQLFTGGLGPRHAGSSGAGEPDRSGGPDPGCGRFAADVCRMYREVMTAGRPTPAADRLLERSSPAGVLDRIEAPTLLIQGTNDSLFPLREADANARGIAATGTPVRVAWYSGGHDGAGSDQDRDHVRALTALWLDHYLRGQGEAPGRSFTYSRVIGRTGSGKPVTAELSAPGYPGLDGSGRPARLTLEGPPQPVANPPGGTPAAVSSLPGAGLLAGVAGSAGAGGSSDGGSSDGGAGGIGDAGGGLGDVPIGTEIPGQAAYFQTPSLGRALDLTGSAGVDVRVASPTGGAVLFAKLYDIAPGGRATLVGGQVTPVRLTGLPRTLGIGPGSAGTHVELPAVVHRFPAGHRVRVVLASADQAYAGPPEPTTYQVALASPRLIAPHVDGRPVGDPAGGWQWVLAALLALAAAALLVAALLARRRRRRAERVEAELADVPIVVEDVHKTYAGGVTAVRGVGFQVERGQVVGLLGPNGAGKTTLLRVLLGLMRPTAGRVLLFGRPVVPGAPVLGRVGALVEGPGFLPHLSGAANLRLYWESTGRPPDEAGFDEVLAIAELGDAIARPVRTYSHGMKQRLAIAQAMLGMPELLVLDEPTDGLDPPQIARMRRVLQRYATDGRTVVVSSHLLAEVEQTCTHVVVMSQGTRVAAGSVAEIIGVEEVLPQHRLEDAFLSLLQREAE